MFFHFSDQFKYHRFCIWKYREHFIECHDSRLGPIFTIHAKECNYQYIMFQYDFRGRDYPFYGLFLQYKTNFFIGV